MTKSELIEVLANQQNLAHRTAEELVNLVFMNMRDTLVKGGRIEIRGFGSFKVQHYRGYVGRNPKTGVEILVKPKRLPVFKVSKVMKQQVDDGRLGG